MHVAARNQSQMSSIFFHIGFGAQSLTEFGKCLCGQQVAGNLCLPVPSAQVGIQVHTTEAWAFLHGKTQIYLIIVSQVIYQLSHNPSPKVFIWTIMFCLCSIPHIRNIKLLSMGWLRCQILVAYKDSIIGNE